MRVRAGTSGYSYKEWKGPFYPEDLKPQEMLRFYATKLSTVEINNTFYRMPSEKMLRDWAEKVPEGFSFVLKASRRITHQKRLADAGDPLSYLLQAASVMGSKLGPFLFQLPPYFKKDTERLRDFVQLLPEDCRAAFEFRNASWFDDEVFDVLRSRGVALVIADTDKDDAPPPVVPTASYGYVRLRREDYDDAALESWASRLTEQPWEEVHVFFKHEDDGAGPRMAGRFEEIIAARG